MKSYKPGHRTQRAEIIDMLFLAGKNGCTCVDFVEAKIPQYNARVNELRGFYSCICKLGRNKNCEALYHIINNNSRTALPRFVSHSGPISEFKGGEKNEKE